MKNLANLKGFWILILLSILHSCRDEEVPTLSTFSVINITFTTASCGGYIKSIGTGIVLETGVCWNTEPDPTVADNKTINSGGADGRFICNLFGLEAGSTYFVRAYATNSAGIGYGDEISFTTAPLSVNDVEGNTYTVIVIGTQVWMGENLKTTKYNDGTTIPLVSDGASWIFLSTPAYCWYNNDSSSYSNTYGALYNWYTVNSRKLCPTGWHVPSDAELTILFDYLGGDTVAGSKLKEAGTTHWIFPNAEASNESGFTALPGGWRYPHINGDFTNINHSGIWWSSTESSQEYSWKWQLGYNQIDIQRGYSNKKFGFSVRCIWGLTY